MICTRCKKEYTKKEVGDYAWNGSYCSVECFLGIEKSINSKQTLDTSASTYTFEISPKVYLHHDRVNNEFSILTNRHGKKVNFIIKFYLVIHSDKVLHNIILGRNIPEVIKYVFKVFFEKHHTKDNFSYVRDREGVVDIYFDYIGLIQAYTQRIKGE